MSFPTPVAEQECMTIDGKQEPIISFLPARVPPASRENDEDQYSLVKERLVRYHYVVTDINDNIIHISRANSIYFSSDVYCRTDMLVGMSKCTEEDYDFAECIRACFRAAYNAQKALCDG